jgi:septal ring-binding cell division protein DamX
VISNTLVRRAVQIEYSLLRTPLAVVNRGLTSRLRKGSKVRLGVERGLGTLDAVAGQLLSPSSSPSSSTDRRNGSATDERAKSPAAADVPADGNVEPTHHEVELSHDDEVERVVEEIREELEHKPVTGELADPGLQEVQAELRAKHLVEEHEEEQRIKREHAERVRAANAARKAPARKSTATKAVAKPAQKTAAKKAPVKKAAAKKTAAKKASGAE